MTYSERNEREEGRFLYPENEIRLNTNTIFFPFARGCQFWCDVEWAPWTLDKRQTLFFEIWVNIQLDHESEGEKMNVEHPHRKSLNWVMLNDNDSNWELYYSLLLWVIIFELLVLIWLPLRADIGEYWVYTFGTVIAYSLIDMDVSPWIMKT